MRRSIACFLASVLLLSGCSPVTSHDKGTGQQSLASAASSATVTGTWAPGSGHSPSGATRLIDVRLDPNGTARRELYVPGAKGQGRYVSQDATWTLSGAGILGYRTLDGFHSRYSAKVSGLGHTKRLVLTWISGQVDRGSPWAQMGISAVMARDVSSLTGSTATVTYTAAQQASKAQ